VVVVSELRGSVMSNRCSGGTEKSGGISQGHFASGVMVLLHAVEGAQQVDLNRAENGCARGDYLRASCACVGGGLGHYTAPRMGAGGRCMERGECGDRGMVGREEIERATSPRRNSLPASHDWVRRALTRPGHAVYVR
jgi:hypothetical protein